MLVERASKGEDSELLCCAVVFLFVLLLLIGSFFGATVDKYRNSEFIESMFGFLKSFILRSVERVISSEIILT